MLMADFISPEPRSAQQARGERGEDSLREAWANALSHELRTPITSIYGGTQLLLRHAVSGPVQVAIIGDIAAEAEHLHRLVEDLLAIVRLPSGSRVRDPRPVLLHHVASQAARDEQRASDGRRVVIDVAPDVPAVRGDAEYLRHLLRNLISNAVRYSPEESLVEVRVTRAGDRVRVEILDRGQGFPAGSGEDAFRLFHQNPQTAERLPGAGIGLFVARALVEAHGGRIWVGDRPGGGSEVGFEIPIDRESIDDAPRGIPTGQAHARNPDLAGRGG
jgi:two-component system, OmpR family, sensor histidine kinase KdpD